jgi:hypothetical protein
MKCPDCRSDVAIETTFCFTCLRHVPAEMLIASDEETAAALADTPIEAPKSKRSWEPGILGTVQAFGRAATNSGWRRSKTEAAH